MTTYLDASALVALFKADAHTARVEAILASGVHTPLVSDFAGAEFASVVGRLVRTGDLTADEARATFATFDGWLARGTRRAETVTADVKVAESFLRRLYLNLRAPDALNIAIAQREPASLITFDARMAESARALGTAVIEA